jgi:DNA-binding SARP family transcriptional activator
VDGDLALGRARELGGELRDLAARHQFHDRLRGQLTLALYRSGRQAEALDVYQEFRRLLSEELGLEPGPPARRRHAFRPPIADRTGIEWICRPVDAARGRQ